MVNHVEYDPNFRTHKHIDKFAARGMLVDIQVSFKTLWTFFRDILYNQGHSRHFELFRAIFTNLETFLDDLRSFETS